MSLVESYMKYICILFEPPLITGCGYIHSYIHVQLFSKFYNLASFAGNFLDFDFPLEGTTGKEHEAKESGLKVPALLLRLMVV